MAAILCCGAECGLTTLGTGHILYLQATTVNTSAQWVRSGVRSWHVNPGAVNNGYISFGALAGYDVIVARGYFYFGQFGSSIHGVLTARFQPEAGAYYDPADGKIYAGQEPFSTGGKGATGVAVSLNTWFCVDILVRKVGSNLVVDVMVNRVPCGTYTVDFAGTINETYVSCGHNGGSLAFDMFADDIVIGNAESDYPFGGGTILPYVPTTDGSHNIAGTGDFQRGNTGVDILNSTTTAYQLVDDGVLPSGTVDEADCIRVVAPPNSSDYVRLSYGLVAGLPAQLSNPRMVSALGAYHQAGTQSGHLLITLGASSIGVGNILNLTGNGVTSYRYALLNAALTGLGVPWTLADVNSMYTLIESSDAAPDQMVDALVVEVEFPQKSLPALRHQHRLSPFLRM